jgi:hypothetical protein
MLPPPAVLRLLLCRFLAILAFRLHLGIASYAAQSPTVVECLAAIKHAFGAIKSTES